MYILKTIILAIKSRAAVVLLLLGLPLLVHATSVLQMNMDELLRDAAVIFEGEVIASEARWNADNTYVTTWVTFRVDDVLKGELPAATITQGFAGGTVADTTLQVSGMVYPQIGETGIYFIENPERQQVNPIVGWSQGHFRVKKDTHGKERVLTENNDPVLAVEAASPVQSSDKSVQALPLSMGAAQGLRVGKSRDALDTAIDKQGFKNALRLRLSVIRAANQPPEHTDNPK